ncbi:MAG: UPF0058 family protein [Methanomicrobiales archaeon]|jgi:hypothetical protein|nr:UPF0058 family protein [Methanomicrobiales archaeon]
MHKDELIALHQMLVEIKGYLEKNDSSVDFSQYEELKINPSQAHKSKMEHKHAIFILGNVIAKGMKDVNQAASGRMSVRMQQLADKALKEMEHQ